MRSVATSFLFGILVVMIFACQQQDEQKLTIAVAANMQPVMTKLVKDFKQKNQIDCDLIFGSSGKLTAQIIEGAPYDLFVAANMTYPTKIYESGLAYEMPKIYATGKLVLWSMIDSLNPSMINLSQPWIEHIAMANPKTAPYGIAALEVLNHFQLFDSIKPKLVYGESISQTNQFIYSQAAQLGFTSLSTVLDSELKNKGNWIEIDTSIYSPINQGIIKVKREKSDAKNAKKFYDFLLSDEAQHLLKEYGYSSK